VSAIFAYPNGASCQANWPQVRNEARVTRKSPAHEQLRDLH